MDLIYIYILELEEGKYYVGRTSDPISRLYNHFSSYNASPKDPKRDSAPHWVKKYKPTGRGRLIPNCDVYDEDKYVKIYMEKYGINNVRGGAYSRIELSEENIRCIEMELLNASDACFHCGKKGHFVKNCPLRIGFVNTNAFAQSQTTESLRVSPKFSNIELNVMPSVSNTLLCERCGRNNHLTSACYAKTRYDGSDLTDWW